MLAFGLAGFVTGPLPASAQIGAAPPSPAEAEEIAPLLLKYYQSPAALRDLRAPADLAALWPGLTAPGPGRGVFLLSSGEAPSKAAPVVHAELLPGRVGYWRAAGFNLPKDGAPLAAGLADWTSTSVGGLIVDLRDTAAPDDYAGATRLASFFVPTGTVLFTVQGLQVPQQVYTTGIPPGDGKVYTLPLAVLVNRQTRGAAEALADALRRDAGAIVVGRSTPGQEALFIQKRLRAAPGRVLRVAQAPVLLPDGVPLAGQPVTPDIAVYVDDRDESVVLAQLDLGPAARGMVEAPIRHRMNEASLVHEENPEIEEILSEQYHQAKPDAAAAPVQDVALMRTVDIVKGIALYPATAALSPTAATGVTAATSSSFP
jgi:hypothetical protein